MPDESNQRQINSCPEIPHFGATYPDATCIDGYLWDSDSYEEGIGFTQGGDDPCPFCNTKLFLEREVDEEAGATEQLVLKWIEEMRVKYS